MDAQLVPMYDQITQRDARRFQGGIGRQISARACRCANFDVWWTTPRTLPGHSLLAVCRAERHSLIVAAVQKFFLALAQRQAVYHIGKQDRQCLCSFWFNSSENRSMASADMSTFSKVFIYSTE